MAGARAAAGGRALAQAVLLYCACALLGRVRQGPRRPESHLRRARQRLLRAEAVTHDVDAAKAEGM